MHFYRMHNNNQKHRRRKKTAPVTTAIAYFIWTELLFLFDACSILRFFLITIKSTHICDALAHSFSHPRRIFWECADTFFWKRPSNSCTPASQPYPEFYANMHQLYSCVRVFVCAVCTAKCIISWSSTACNSQMERSKIISIPFHPQMQCGISSLHNNQFVPKNFFFSIFVVSADLDYYLW